MIITIFGLPGSGKGTQSEFLIKKYKLKLISIGDLLRNSIFNRDELGKKIKNTVESGNLIQDKIICDLLYKQISSIDDNFLLDGFPRNLNQSYFLTKILFEKYNRDIDIVIELDLDDKDVIYRLNNRILCFNCKSIYSLKKDTIFVCMKCKSTKLEKRIDDSNLSSINRRIKEYHIQIKSLREYYSSKLLTINANLDIYKIKEEIENKISSNLI